ncbi:hypothetical protein G5S35_23515 [Paraburkholderia tropica]|uniref:hypothetical protein n=1 Tax=Paraburkholderia tropica TaxID=92647 RepID=UPI001603748F|nr:hypothetical protein [Paraburkholderia tropica]QNB14647.1 hypothetical protein G5S35_23515 [Paraburkholderia tropica]
MLGFRESKWSFNTSATGSLSVEVLAASGGTIVLNDPDQKEHEFTYGTFGIGLGIGFKLPKIRLAKLHLPEISMPTIAGRDIGGSVATRDFPSTGSVFMTRGFQGDELSARDFRGGVLLLDASAGVFEVAGGTLMLLGLNQAMLISGLLASPGNFVLSSALSSARAGIVTYGRSAALQAGAGTSFQIGAMT